MKFGAVARTVALALVLLVVTTAAIEVADTMPKNGDPFVDPGLNQLHVEFSSEPMMNVRCPAAWFCRLCAELVGRGEGNGRGPFLFCVDS